MEQMHNNQWLEELPVLTEEIIKFLSESANELRKKNFEQDFDFDHALIRETRQKLLDSEVFDGDCFDENLTNMRES